MDLIVMSSKVGARLVIPCVDRWINEAAILTAKHAARWLVMHETWSPLHSVTGVCCFCICRCPAIVDSTGERQQCSSAQQASRKTGWQHFGAMQQHLKGSRLSSADWTLVCKVAQAV